MVCLRVSQRRAEKRQAAVKLGARGIRKKRARGYSKLSYDEITPAAACEVEAVVATELVADAAITDPPARPDDNPQETVEHGLATVDDTVGNTVASDPPLETVWQALEETVEHQSREAMEDEPQASVPEASATDEQIHPSTIS